MDIKNSFELALAASIEALEREAKKEPINAEAVKALSATVTALLSARVLARS